MHGEQQKINPGLPLPGRYMAVAGASALCSVMTPLVACCASSSTHIARFELLHCTGVGHMCHPIQLALRANSDRDTGAAPTAALYMELDPNPIGSHRPQIGRQMNRYAPQDLEQRICGRQPPLQVRAMKPHAPGATHAILLRYGESDYASPEGERYSCFPAIRLADIGRGRSRFG